MEGDNKPARKLRTLDSVAVVKLRKQQERRHEQIVSWGITAVALLFSAAIALYYSPTRDATQFTGQIFTGSQVSFNPGPFDVACDDRTVLTADH